MVVIVAPRRIIVFCVDIAISPLCQPHESLRALQEFVADRAAAGLLRQRTPSVGRTHSMISPGYCHEGYSPSFRCPHQRLLLG
jgi:hypothetical protein